MKILYRKEEIFNGYTLDELNNFVENSDYGILKNIYSLRNFEQKLLISEEQMGILNFTKMIPKFKNNIPVSVDYWIERGWSEIDSKNKSEYFKNKISNGLKTNIPKKKRIENAKNANKKRIKQIKKLQENGEYNKTNPTFIEYYLNKGMTQEEAEQALKERQTTFSKEICIEKYGKEEGLSKLKKRNKKWINSLKENNDWDELSKSKAITLDKMISKYGEEEGTERYEDWKSACSHTKENFIKRHGEKEGLEKWKIFKSQRNSLYGTSKEAESFFNSIINEIKHIVDISEIYMDTDNSNEYFINYNNGRNKYYYDFTIASSNIIIEYHGTHVHPNPNWEKEKWDNWTHAFNKKTANKIRSFDEKKKSLAESQGFTVLEIWNDDNPKSNHQKVIDSIINQN